MIISVIFRILAEIASLSGISAIKVKQLATEVSLSHLLISDKTNSLGSKHTPWLHQPV